MLSKLSGLDIKYDERESMALKQYSMHVENVVLQSLFFFLHGYSDALVKKFQCSRGLSIHKNTAIKELFSNL